MSPMRRWNLLDPVLFRWRINSRTRLKQIVALTELRLAAESDHGNTDEYLAADVACHNCMIEACGNFMLTSMRTHRTSDQRPPSREADPRRPGASLTAQSRAGSRSNRS